MQEYPFDDLHYAKVLIFIHIGLTRIITHQVFHKDLVLLTLLSEFSELEFSQLALATKNIAFFDKFSPIESVNVPMGLSQVKVLGIVLDRLGVSTIFGFPRLLLD